MEVKKLYINGEWVASHSDAVIEVESPINHQILGIVPAGDEVDVNLAVSAARAAFVPWWELGKDARCEYLMKFKEELTRAMDDIAALIVLELGTNARNAVGIHIKGYVNAIQEYVGFAKSEDWFLREKDYIIAREPFGVVAGITPWNYPLGQIISKMVPALIAGNTFVLKPSQQTPLTAIMIAEAAHRAGLPKGVFNLVTGRGGEVGDVLAKHPDVDLLSFTGSTAGGKQVYQIAAASTGKKVIMELGGKSPAVLLDPDYYEKGVKNVLSLLFSNVGQTCAAWSRLIVPRKDLKQIEEMVVKTCARFEFGDPRTGDRVVGPLASRKQFDKVASYISKGVAEGAKLILGREYESYEGSYQIGATIFSDVDNSMSIAQDEIFGPVLCIIPYDTEEEALEIANDTIYGLSGVVFGEPEKALEFAGKIRSGEISINGNYSRYETPFGGYKQSGIGREGSKFGLDEYLEIKTIHVGE